MPAMREKTTSHQSKERQRPEGENPRHARARGGVGIFPAKPGIRGATLASGGRWRGACAGFVGSCTYFALPAGTTTQW